MDRILLASRSPRRRVLLGYLLDGFDTGSVPVLEEAPRGLPVEAALETIAAKKALALSAEHPDRWVLAADTVVSYRGQLLNKPTTRSKARRNLEMLADQDFEVSTGIALARRERRVDIDAETTRLHLAPLPEEALEDYLDRDAWEDKAGGIAIQDPVLGKHISIIEGPWSNVVGLPLGRVHAMLRRNRLPCKVPPDETFLRDHNPFDARSR